MEIVWKRGAEGVESGQGERFTRLLDGKLQNLRRHPAMAPVFERPMRRLVAGNSGYGLFYPVEPRGIVVQALLHLSQNPAIRERIRRMLDLR